MNVYDKAAQILKDGGRTTGKLKKVDGSHCLIGALGAAKGIDVSTGSEDRLSAYFLPEAHTLAKIAREQFPDRIHYNAEAEQMGTAVGWFNDNHNTTDEDVFLVLEKASIQHDEKTGL